MPAVAGQVYVEVRGLRTGAGPAWQDIPVQSGTHSLPTLSPTVTLQGAHQMYRNNCQMYLIRKLRKNSYMAIKVG